MRNHASWGTMRDIMIVFLNCETYDKARLSKEERELAAEIEKLAKADESKDGDKADKKEPKDKKQKARQL